MEIRSCAWCKSELPTQTLSTDWAAPPPASFLFARTVQAVSSAPDAGTANDTISSNITGPFVLVKVDSEYSGEARKGKYSGTVTLRIDINTSGQVSRATVIASLGMGLDEKAIEAVTKWKFIPARKDGKPVDSESEVSMNFPLL